MQLEAGKCYVDRKGRVFGPMESNEGGTFGEGSHGNWYSDGRQSFRYEMPTDLIAEHVPEPSYRMLQAGELVERGDELIVGTSWTSVSACIGDRVIPYYVGSFRRRIVPSPVQEWRMLESGETIQSGDELLRSDKIWIRANALIGDAVLPMHVGKVRRRIVAQVSSDQHMLETECISHVLRPGVDSVLDGNAWIPYTGEKTCLGMTTYARARFAKSAAPVALPRDINYIPRYADGWKPDTEVYRSTFDMLNIIFHPDSTSEEREQAASTLVEAVYPEILARKQ